MSDDALQVLEMLTCPGPRLSMVGEWLLTLWTCYGYPHQDPVAFLDNREKEVDKAEALIAAAAPRFYDEFQTPPPPNRGLLRFLLDARPCAAVVFDGLSLREMPALLHLAKESGMPAVEVGFSTAAIPSETIDFVEQRLGLPAIGPSQLPKRTELKDQGVRTYYLPAQSIREEFDRQAQALLIWSAFPDVTYKDSGARFAQHFAQLDATLRQAWMNTVQAVPPGRRILITSDHGYVYFGPGLSAPRRREELSEIVSRLGGQRSSKLRADESPLVHRDIATMQVPTDGRVMMVRGRVQTHASGEQASRLYKHGGLSLMEMFTPWLVLQS